MYVLGVLAWMVLWIASNGGLYSVHAPLLALQFCFAGIIIGIWMSVIRLPDDTARSSSLLIAVLIGAIATLVGNVLFGIWTLDMLNTKCQNPAAYGCAYVQICQTEQSYMITAIVFVAYLTAVDLIAIVASLVVLGKAYPSVSTQVKLAED